MTNKDKEIKKALTHFKLHSYALRNGKGLLSKRLKVSQEAVEIARNLIKKSIEDTTKVSAPKILILDIETAPMKAYVWKRWKEDISLDQTISEWFCLAWAAKWLYNPSGEYSSDIVSEVLTPSQVKDENDYFIMCKLRGLLDQADIVVAHNACVEKSTPVLMKDFTWKPAGELKEGEEIIGFEEGLPPGVPLRDSENNWQNPLKGRSRNLVVSKITHNKVVEEECVRVNFTNGYSLITTFDHPWLMKTPKDNFLKWRESQFLKPGDRIIRLCVPWEKNTSYEGAWLSGFISGEGSLMVRNGAPTSIQWCQRPTQLKKTADMYADTLGIARFDYLPKTNWGLGKGDCVYTNTLGGKFTVFKWLGSLELNRLKEHVDYTNLGGLICQNTEDNDQEVYYVASVEPCGKHEIAQLSTSTGTYIADGFAMHNCKFDIPRINSRFISLGINPPTPYYIVDTLREARKVFDFSSNKLDALASFMKTGTKKIKTDFSLWKSCMEGDEEALELMRDYNERDVYVLEKVYLKMRPFIKGHPNVGAILAKDNVCPICGSPLVTKYPGYYSTSVNRYTLYKCDRCHSIVRSRKPEEKSKVTHTSLGH